VGLTTTGDGRNMVNYDIAVAGSASGMGYIDVSFNFCFLIPLARRNYVRCS